MTETATATKPGWRTLLRALRHRKTGFMALFGFASGLPFALFLGTLYAWLTEAEVDLETMGVFSLIGLAYSFQFLWSPLLNRIDIPGLRRLGKRKQWIVPAQVLLGIVLVTMSMLDPKSGLGWFSLLAAIGGIIEQHMIDTGFLQRATGLSGAEAETAAPRVVDSPEAISSLDAPAPADLRQCPRCGSLSLLRQEGCDLCTACGYSHCG